VAEAMAGDKGKSRKYWGIFDHEKDKLTLFKKSKILLLPFFVWKNSTFAK